MGFVEVGGFDQVAGLEVLRKATSSERMKMCPPEASKGFYLYPPLR